MKVELVVYAETGASFSIPSIQLDGRELSENTLWIHHSDPGRRTAIEFDIFTDSEFDIGEHTLHVTVEGQNSSRYLKKNRAIFSVSRLGEDFDTPQPSNRLFQNGKSTLEALNINSHTRGEELFMTYDPTFG